MLSRCREPLLCDKIRAEGVTVVRDYSNTGDRADIVILFPLDFSKCLPLDAVFMSTYMTDMLLRQLRFEKSGTYSVAGQALLKALVIWAHSH